MSQTSSPPPDSATIAEAKRYLRAHWTAGATCPCCTQRVQLYRRTITAGMALALLSLYRATRALPAAGAGGDGHLSEDPYLHAEKTFKADRSLPQAARGDFTKLALWGMIEPAPGKREDGSTRNGYWRITETGRLFAEGKLAVRKYVWLFNNREYAPPDGEARARQRVMIGDALGKRYDYSEMMNAGRETTGRVAA